MKFTTHKSVYRVVCLLMAAGFAGCASLPTENQDPTKNNKATYNIDLKECKEDYPVSGSGVHVRQWIGCMNLKGWR